MFLVPNIYNGKTRFFWTYTDHLAQKSPVIVSTLAFGIGRTLTATHVIDQSSASKHIKYQKQWAQKWWQDVEAPHVTEKCNKISVNEKMDGSSNMFMSTLVS